jgi:[NiFe] hydrogenase assembly HybE family chaperone
MKRLRIPAFMAPPPEPAQPFVGNPSALIESFYRTVWLEQMSDLPFVNPVLSVEAVGFRQVEGDWVGMVITPWFINLFLLPGGGSLWQDLPSGEQRGVVFPAGQLDFIADNNPDSKGPISAYQYCPLIHPVQHLPDQATAREAAQAALVTLFTPPLAPEPEVSPVTAEPAPRRRAFLRGLVGQRDSA